MGKYAIGIDFGTLSGRVLVVDVATGRETATCEYAYPHAVMDTEIAGQPLPPDFALQHPSDYIGVLAAVGPLLETSDIDPADVIGVGIDFTACTIMPVRKDGTPICQLNQFFGHPHAYVKLWKHHAAQQYANELNRVAQERGEAFLPRYGGKISSEWAIPKMWQVLKEAPDVWAATDAFVEAADWVVWQLCGELRRNSCTAGYKAMWHKHDGFPGEDFFAALDPALRTVVHDKLWGDIHPIGEKAGEITPWAADVTGLLPGTAVAVANVDAHVCVPAVTIESEGKMLGIMGTSTCHMLLSREEKLVEGMCGVVEDGILPGFYGYEAGQSCVGDHFSWFIDNCLPVSVYEEAQAKGQNIHRLLGDKMVAQKAGESGLIALDWWNGNRSILVDADLTGLIVGLTLQTKPEEIYRALIEATAYGARRIVESFRDAGVSVDEFYAAGGIAQKDPQTMQIYADVLDMPIRIAGSKQGPALGSAIFGAVAAGREKGGYGDVFEAARAMGSVRDDVYRPQPDEAKMYDKLYAEYKLLHDYFGRGENDVMKRLKTLKKEIRANG